MHLESSQHLDESLAFLGGRQSFTKTLEPLMELEVGSFLKHFAEQDAGGGGGRATLEEGGTEAAVGALCPS